MLDTRTPGCISLLSTLYLYCQGAGLSPLLQVVLMSSSVLQTCQICFEDYTTMDMFAAPCNHHFCR